MENKQASVLVLLFVLFAIWLNNTERLPLIIGTIKYPQKGNVGPAPSWYTGAK